MKTLAQIFKAGSLNTSLLLAVVAFLVYCPSLSYDYVLDDAIVISENEFTQQGVSGIPEIWTHDTFRGFFGEDGKSSLVQGGRYRPMSLTFFALEGHLFGFDPFVGHFFNLFWYAVLCGLIYVVLYSLLRKHKEGKWIALTTTLLFLFHPVHSEVVANIKGRDEILAMLGGIGALYVLIRYKGLKSYLLSFILLFFGLFSKEHAAVFLVLIPMTLYTVKNRQWWGSLIPSGLALAVYLVSRYLVLGSFIQDSAPKELLNNPFMVWDGNSYELLSLMERWPTVFSVLPEYLRLIVWPFPLTHDYYPQSYDILTGWNGISVISLMLFSGLTIWAMISLKDRKWWSLGWLWFVVALFPMSNLLINVGTFVSERFLFLPSLGALLCISVLIYRLFQPKLVIGFSLAWCILFMVWIQLRLPAWSSNFSLFTTDVHTSSQSAKANNAAGAEYNKLAGKNLDTEDQKKWAQKAKTYLEKAIQLHPTYKNAHLQMGNTHFYLNNFQQAIENYNYCLQLDPNYEDAKNNLFLAYRSGGQFMGEQKNDLNAALEYLNKAYSMRPEDYETLRLLGVAYGVSGAHQKAVDFFKKALQKRPNDPYALYNLGASYLQVGKVDSGQVYLDQARKLDPKVFKQ